ncbi:cyclic-di-GMP-binding biofilm dispersal mediator protein [Sphingobium sp. AP50]|uniref:SDR family oxidoreductase n=1 Tax=Sphingobium sp. AP50 TaxID=1884369 RepID=UPI0008AC2906|nr:SDR family oxidoreductase [Sphingobium sp. AP50]SEI78105.1 cyclic-di-GMP-binding biofilm dispersal mediator protein [Sphingobium sp. AP50]
MTDLSSKKTLILGGSRGIGAAIVRRFAGDGADVTFTYAGSHDAAQALAVDTGATPVQSDAADRRAVIGVVSAQGPLDILIVNAGALVLGDPLTLDADAVDRMIDINVRAPYHAAVEAARQMRDGGRIIVIGSVNGDRMPFEGGAAYAMTKSALQGMARGLARDFGARGITVNIIQPGPTDTDMNPSDGPMASLMHGFMAIKRHATGQEIAGLAAYLAGPEAGIITGALHTIDGGFGA